MVYFVNMDSVSRVRRAHHERVLVLLQTLSSVNILSLLSEQEYVPKIKIVYLKDGFSRFTPYTRHWREFSDCDKVHMMTRLHLMQLEKKFLSWHKQLRTLM